MSVLTVVEHDGAPRGAVPALLRKALRAALSHAGEQEARSPGYGAVAYRSI